MESNEKITSDLRAMVEGQRRSEDALRQHSAWLQADLDAVGTWACALAAEADSLKEVGRCASIS